jgi:hypothetical protein
MSYLFFPPEICPFSKYYELVHIHVDNDVAVKKLIRDRAQE